MQSSKEQKGDLRKPSSAINAKKNRGKQQNGKDQRSPQENQRYQGNISCKDGHKKKKKDRNSMELTEAEDSKRQQEYT